MVTRDKPSMNHLCHCQQSSIPLYNDKTLPEAYVKLISAHVTIKALHIVLV